MVSFGENASGQQGKPALGVPGYAVRLPHVWRVLFLLLGRFLRAGS